MLVPMSPLLLYPSKAVTFREPLSPTWRGNVSLAEKGCSGGNGVWWGWAQSYPTFCGKDNSKAPV